MNSQQFAQICLDASERLALKNTGALSSGFPTTVDGVDVEILHRESNPDGLHLVFELGAPAPEHRLEAYEALLSLQTLWMSEMNGLFAYDAAGDRLLFVLNAPTPDDTTGEQLASMIKGFAALVIEWRQTVLQGKMDDAWLADGLLLSDPASHI